MATESPLLMPFQKEETFPPPAPVEDLGLLVKGQSICGSGKDLVNRSESAPPSIEGSFLSLISQQNPSINKNFGRVNDVVPNINSENLSYLAYLGSNNNVNARLPTPPIPRDKHVDHHFGRLSRNWTLASTGNSSNDSLHFSQAILSTHKEEPEDDHSPRRPFHGTNDGRIGLLSGENAASLIAQSKSLVDLIQEDFPSTASPVCNQSQSLSSETADEGSGLHHTDPSFVHDPHVISPNTIASTPGSMQPSQRENPNSSDLAVIEFEMKGLALSSTSNPDELKGPTEWQSSYQSTILPHQVHHQGNSFQVQNAKYQVDSQGVNSSYVGVDQFPHGSSSFTAEVQPVLQSSGFTPPLYATAAAYLTSSNPFYNSFQSSGIYPPQYDGGYALNSTVIPPFVAGYSSHGSTPMFDGPTCSNFNPRLPGATLTHGVEIQQFDKAYGQPGYTLQPPLTDPLYMQYYQQHYGPMYNTSSQFDPLPFGGDVIGNQSNSPDSKRRSEFASNDHKLPHNRSALINLNQFRGGTMSPHYFGNPPNMGAYMQYASSPLTNPSLPRSPVGGSSNSGGIHETRIPPDSGRYRAAYSGWQGQRGVESFSDPMIYNFLEELKSGKGRKFQLSDIAGHIVEFSADQHGSRFIQQKLESCSAEEKTAVFKEVLPCASKLMTDVFGNYVIQKFFEYGSPEQRKELANKLSGQIVDLSLQMYGCRVIQKALEVIESNQKAELVHELDGHIMRCVCDQNGNHVIQKCIESVPTEHIGFVISAFRGQVATLSKHPYGCRVIQRVLEHCADDLQCQFIVDEILESVCDLAQDQYGNYVTQHVLERGKANERSQIIGKLSGHMVLLSQHKFASNVIEKCLEFGATSEQDIIIEEILSQSEGNDNLLTMMKDQFANYVVQKVLDTCTDTQRAILLDRIKAHAHALKKYTYGKHIVARFELQFGEDVQH